MADCKSRKVYVFMKHMWLKSVVNVHLITDSLGLHKMCILNRTSSKEEYEWYDN